MLLALIALKTTHVICKPNAVNLPRDPTDYVDGKILNDVIIDNPDSSQQEKKMDKQAPDDVISKAYDRDVIHTNDVMASDESKPEVLEVIDGSKIESGSIVDDVLSKFKNFKKPNKGEDWSKSTFTRALKDLGVFNLKGLKVMKMKSDMITDLKKQKKGMKIIKATKPREKVPMNKNKSASVKRNVDVAKRTSGYDLCTEYVDTMYVLAHQSSQLAYSVDTVRCEGNCVSQTYGLTFGSCNLATKTMTVYVINDKSEFVPETITPGCACECLFTNQ